MSFPPPTASSPPASYTIALQQYHSDLRERLIWAVSAAKVSPSLVAPGENTPRGSSGKNLRSHTHTHPHPHARSDRTEEPRLSQSLVNPVNGKVYKPRHLAPDAEVEGDEYLDQTMTTTTTTRRREGTEVSAWSSSSSSSCSVLLEDNDEETRPPVPQIQVDRFTPSPSLTTTTTNTTNTTSPPRLLRTYTPNAGHYLKEQNDCDKLLPTRSRTERLATGAVEKREGTQQKKPSEEKGEKGIKGEGLLRAKFAALGLGLTSIPPIPVRPVSSSAGASASTGARPGLTTNPSEESFTGLTRSPLWTPSVNPLIRDRMLNGSHPGGSINGGIPFWSVPPSRPGLNGRRNTAQSQSQTGGKPEMGMGMGVDEPRLREPDDDLDLDLRERGGCRTGESERFMEELLEGYWRPRTPMMEQGKPISPGLPLSSDRAVNGNNNTTTTAMTTMTQTQTTTGLSVQVIPPRLAGRESWTSWCLSDSGDERDTAATNANANANANANNNPVKRVIRNMSFQRPHHKGGNGKGRGGDWFLNE